MSKYSREKHLETVLKDLISKYFFVSNDPHYNDTFEPNLMDLDCCNMAEEHKELFMQLMELAPEVVNAK